MRQINILYKLVVPQVLLPKKFRTNQSSGGLGLPGFSFSSNRTYATQGFWLQRRKSQNAM